MKDRLNRIKEDYLIPIVLIGTLYVVFAVTGIGCPIKFVTGISCPGCGMTRSVIALLRFDFKNAFMYHPLFLLVFIFCIIYLLKRYINKKVYTTIMYVFVLLFIVIYLYRMFDPSDLVVVFKPGEGLIARILSKF